MKAKPANERKIRLNLRMTARLHRMLVAHSQRSNLTITWIVEHAVRDYLATK